MGLEFMEIAQDHFEEYKRNERQRRYKARRIREIKRQILACIILVFVLFGTACASNKEMTKAILEEKQFVTFESVYGVTEDCGLTVVVEGGKADGNVWDIDPSVAKYCEEPTHVEVIMNTHNSDNVEDWEPIKVMLLSDYIIAN